MLVIHPHFHRRRTGVTTHTEQMVSALASHVETQAVGWQLAASLPRTSMRDVWKRSLQETVVWHAHRNLELLVGLLLRIWRRRLKVVFTRHDSKPPGRWTRFLARKADARITLNEAGAEMLGLPSTQVGHKVDTQRFGPPVSRDEAFRRLQLPGKFGIGVVGRIRPEKGQGDFVHAVAPLLTQFSEWTPVLVGQAKTADAAFEKSLRSACAGRLHCVGEQENVSAWYQGLTVVVQPSHREAFSMVALEAMASGACLVASRLPYVNSLLEDNVTGFLYEPGNILQLRKILFRLMTHPEEARRVGQRAAQVARSQFGVEHEARALFELYQRL